MFDDARLSDGGEDERRSTHDVARPNHSGDLLFVVDAVLQRNHRSVRVEQRMQLTRGAFSVVGLHAEQHGIAGPNLCRVICRRDRDPEIAAYAPNPQTLVSDSGQVRPTGDKRYVVAPQGKPAAKVAADTAGTNHHNLHARLPLCR
jgi:hypothetical protein